MSNKLTKDDFQIFSDPSYYGMWCLKPKKIRDFNYTIHFSDQRTAEHALEVILEWFK